VSEEGAGNGSGPGRRYTVAVGVSSTSRSPAALRWALAEAAVHHGHVIALRAWRPTRPPGTTAGRPPLVPVGDTADLQQQEQAQLEADVAQVLGPDAGVECRLVHGGPRKTLRSVSRFVDLLVIDAPRRSDLRETPLFARRLVYTASCPVVIMPPSVADQPDTAMVSAGKKLGRRLMDAAGSAGRPGVRPGATAD
jgi:nucleotide-binding universal stress UspA family protein